MICEVRWKLFLGYYIVMFSLVNGDVERIRRELAPEQCQPDIQHMEKNATLQQAITNMMHPIFGSACDSPASRNCESRTTTSVSRGKHIVYTTSGWKTSEADRICRQLKGKLCHIDAIFGLKDGWVKSLQLSLYQCIPWSCTQKSDMKGYDPYPLLKFPPINTVYKECLADIASCNITMQFCGDSKYDFHAFAKEVTPMSSNTSNSASIQSSNVLVLNTLAILLFVLWRFL